MSARRASALDLSRRVRSLQVSPTVSVFQRVRELVARGIPVLDFSVGEPDQPTPDHVRRAAERALEAGRTRYTVALGLPELRQAVARRYLADFQVAFAPDEVAVTSGGKFALYSVCQVLLDPGDEVLVPHPCWPTFNDAVRLAGGRPVAVPTSERNGFRITARALDRAATRRTRAVVVCSPMNPTGAVVSPRELLGIARLAERRPFTLLYDDTYAHLTFGRRDPPPLRRIRERMADRLVILGTASKSYCMTGWRIGWVLGPRALIQACAGLNSHSIQSPATFAQLGAVAALSGSQRPRREMAREYRRRRDRCLRALRRIRRVRCLEPQGGFYLFPNLKAFLTHDVPDTATLAAGLLDQERVAVVPGEGFGAPGHVRISLARPIPELEEGMRRLGSFLEGLKGRPERRAASRS
jgi:aspartate aminotransferase